MKLLFIIFAFFMGFKIQAQTPTDFQNKDFKTWLGKFKGKEKTKTQLSETEIEIKDCTKTGCWFSAIISYEPANDENPKGAANGECELEGNFKFLEKNEAAAWSATRGEFEGDSKNLKGDRESWSYLRLVKKNLSISLDTTRVKRDQFCTMTPQKTSSKVVPTNVNKHK